MSRRLGPVRRQVHDPVRAADEALATMIDSAWAFSRSSKRLAPEVIRELLTRKPVDATHVYLTLAVDPELDDAALANSWAHAIHGLSDLEAINRWGSKVKREKFQALAKDPHLLHAIRGASANGENVSNNMLAVLVADGSDESFDALVPHLEPIGDRLDALRMLRIHAADTPRLRALFSYLDRDAATAASPAQQVSRIIGLPDDDGFWFSAKLFAGTVQLDVIVDSRKAAWFEVFVDGHLSFTHDAMHHDARKLGRCDATELPSWLAKAASKLRVTWDKPLLSSNVRGAKRDQIAQWLLGD
jgi:hypothetical protein